MPSGTTQGPPKRCGSGRRRHRRHAPRAHQAPQMAQAKVNYLRDVLPQWKASKKRKPQTEQAAEKAVQRWNMRRPPRLQRRGPRRACGTR